MAGESPAEERGETDERGSAFRSEAAPFREIKKIKVLVGIPLTEPSYYQSYRERVVRAIESNFTGVCKRAQHEIFVNPRTAEKGYRGVAEASNLLIERLLRENWDYLWIVEGDVEVPSHALRRLLCAGADVNLGIYPYHRVEELRMLAGYFKKRPPRNPPEIVRVEDRACLEGRIFTRFVCGGVGCCLLNRRVFEKARNLRFVHDIERFTVAVGGHDQLFLWEAQLYGVKVFLHGDVVCGHLPEWELKRLA